MNKKFKLGFGIAIILLASVLVTTAMAGGSAEPGTIDDPVVTKSYVDEKIYQLQQNPSVNDGTGSTGVVAPIEVEKLNTGDIIIGKSGAEIIVRSGKTVAYGDGANGIPDITGGIDIAIGKSISLNHQLIFPRDDGRGIKIIEGPSYIMIRGPYEIIKAQ